MEHHYEYSTHNSHHKVLVNLQASTWTLSKVKAARRQIRVFTFVARRCRKSPSFSAFI